MNTTRPSGGAAHAVLFNADIFLIIVTEFLSLSDHFACESVCRDWHSIILPLLKKERWTADVLLDLIPEGSRASRTDFERLYDKADSERIPVMNGPLSEQQLAQLLRRCRDVRSIRFSAEDPFIYCLLQELEALHPSINLFPDLEALIMPQFKHHSTRHRRHFGRNPNLLTSQITHLHIGRRRHPNPRNLFSAPTQTSITDVSDSNLSRRKKKMKLKAESTTNVEDQTQHATCTDSNELRVLAPRNLVSLRIITDDTVATKERRLWVYGMSPIKHIVQSNQLLKHITLPAVPDNDGLLMLSSLPHLEDLQLGHPNATMLNLYQYQNEANYVEEEVRAAYFGNLRKLHCYGFGITPIMTSYFGQYFVAKELTEFVQQYPFPYLLHISIPLMLEHFCRSTSDFSKLVKIDVRHDEPLSKPLYATAGAAEHDVEDRIFPDGTEKRTVPEGSFLLQPSCMDTFIKLCYNLEHLVLHLPKGSHMRLDDDFILLLSKSCPRLRVLSLCPTHHSLSSTSFQALINLGLHAQQLEVLRLGLDPNIVHEPPTSNALRAKYGWALHPLHVKELDLGTPKVADYNMAVNFLREYFPEVTVFTPGIVNSFVIKQRNPDWNLVIDRVLSANRAEAALAVVVPKLPKPAVSERGKDDVENDDNWAAYDPEEEADFDFLSSDD